MYLICHVTLPDHLIEGHANIWMGAPQSKSCEHGNYDSGDIAF